MKTKEITAITLLITSFLLACFQIAIWLVVPQPSREVSVLEAFWFILEMLVPFIIAIICLIVGSKILESEDDKFLN